MPQEKSGDKENPCGRCTLCCEYMSLEIEPPLNEENFDKAKWYLYHGGELFIEEGVWHVQVNVPCQHLADQGCAIYESRPLICRRYDHRECEQYGKPNFVMIRTIEDLEKYSKK